MTNKQNKSRICIQTAISSTGVAYYIIKCGNTFIAINTSTGERSIAIPIILCDKIVSYKLILSSGDVIILIPTQC